MISVDESKTTLEAVFPVSISETDCLHLVKPVVILNFMQDLAAKSIDTYDSFYSCENLLKKGLGWFLIRYRIEFEKHPLDVKELKVKTECRGAQKMTTYRDFEVYDNVTGERILRAVSSWLIVDIENKSVINIAKEFPDFLKFKTREEDITLQKLKSFIDYDYEKHFEVRYDDLDMNNHVNNTVYITWALEMLDFEFRKNYRIKSLDIYFKHEAKYGDKIVSQVKYDEDNLVTEHIIKNACNGEDLCLIKAEYNKI